MIYQWCRTVYILNKHAALNIVENDCNKHKLKKEKDKISYAVNKPNNCMFMLWDAFGSQ